MPLNPTAAEFKPSRSEPISIAGLPSDPFGQDVPDVSNTTFALIVTMLCI